MEIVEAIAEHDFRAYGLVGTVSLNERNTHIAGLRALISIFAQKNNVATHIHCTNFACE